jgi:hypothetical protein
MRHRKISSGEIIYAIVLRSDGVEPGLKFYTSESDFLQVGSWRYERGKKLKPHAHKICERKSNLTQEFVFIKKGKLRLDVYDNLDSVIESLELGQGDLAILLAGGHAYEILEDDTQVIEVKNGPYPGLEADKRLIL